MLHPPIPVIPFPDTKRPHTAHSYSKSPSSPGRSHYTFKGPVKGLFGDIPPHESDPYDEKKIMIALTANRSIPLILKDPK